MNFKNIMIHQVKTHYTAEHIAFTLLTKEICHISSITLIPQIDNGEIYNIAYIDIDMYCDTEAAYEFIHSIKDGLFILHHDNDVDNPWTFQLNTHNFGGLSVGTFTTQFTQKHCNNTYTSSSQTQLLEFRPIIGIADDHYSVDEALDYIHFLNDSWHFVHSPDQRRKIESLIQHFDNELRIHHSLLNSQYVSSR